MLDMDPSGTLPGAQQQVLTRVRHLLVVESAARSTPTVTPSVPAIGFVHE